MTINRVIVGYDGSPHAHAAVDWALDAARMDTPVRLVHAFQWPAAVAHTGAGPDTWADQTARSVAQAIVDTAVDVAKETRPRARVTGTVLTGPPPTVLRTQSRYASLVVVGGRGRSGFTGPRLGSVSAAVVAQAHCPVVVVCEPAPHGGPVVVGVDGSSSSMLALAFAFEQAEAWQVPLHAVNVRTPATVRCVLPGVDPCLPVAGQRAALNRLLADWQRKYPEVLVTSQAVAGSPGKVLVDASRYGRLAVVGCRGHGDLGSVSQHLLHHAHCPVAVVREREGPAYRQDRGRATDGAKGPVPRFTGPLDGPRSPAVEGPESHGPKPLGHPRRRGARST